MKNVSSLERGQAIVLIAFAIVGLVAMTGLAIDGGMAFADRRHAQNAADAAALAGALEKINGWGVLVNIMKNTPGYEEYCGIGAAHIKSLDEAGRRDILVDCATVAALDIAEEHGYGIALNEVFVNIPPEGGPYDGDDNYVQVIIDTRRDTFFGGVVGIDKMHNTVEAVARAKEIVKEPFVNGSGLSALDPEGCDSFLFGGSGDVLVDGSGLWVNSVRDKTVDPCDAFKQAGGCGGSLTSPSGDPVSIQIVGGYDEDENCTENVNGVYDTGVDQIPWPEEVYLLERPDACDNPAPAPTVDAGVATFQSGYYYDDHFFPPNVPHADSGYVFSPGVYCIENLKILSGDINTGHGVFFYILDGGTFDIQGGANDFSAMTITDPADDNYFYSGFLFYAAPASNYEDPTNNAPDCTLNGNQDSHFVGTIYAPFCDITINGNTGTTDGFHSQVVGFTIKLNGDGDLLFIYDDEENGFWIEPGELNLSQ